MKKILSIVTAAVLAVTLAGCSAKQLTADEYRTEMDVAFREWMKTTVEYAKYYGDTVMADISDASIEKEFESYQNHKDGIKQKLNDVEDALDKIDKVGKPPAEYDDLHNQLKNGVSIEREWLSLQRESLSARSAEEFEETGDKITKLLDDTVDESLSSVYFEMYMQWKSEERENRTIG